MAQLFISLNLEHFDHLDAHEYFNRIGPMRLRKPLIPDRRASPDAFS